MVYPDPVFILRVLSVLPRLPYQASTTSPCIRRALELCGVALERGEDLAGILANHQSVKSCTAGVLTAVAEIMHRSSRCKYLLLI